MIYVFNIRIKVAIIFSIMMILLIPNSVTAKYFDNNIKPVHIPEYESDPSLIDMNFSSNEEYLPWLKEYIETNWENEQSIECDVSTNNITEISMAPTEINHETDYPIKTFDLNSSVRNGGFCTLEGEATEMHGTRSEPGDDDAPVTPLTPAKEGHWFPKMSQARLYFSFVTAATVIPVDFTIHLEIDRDQDTYSRYLRVYLDGSKFYEAVIGSSGFHGDIPFSAWGGSHAIWIEIYYGGYKEKGWKLKYFWVYDAADEPVNVNGEYTHQSYYCNLRYQVKMGDNTKLSIEVVNNYDWSTRWCYVYVDDTYKTRFTVPRAIEVSLGSYTDDSIHELRLKIFSCSGYECGKKITQLMVHHDGAKYEMDYRYDHEPDQATIDYIDAYFKKYSYHRVELYLGQSLTFADYITGDDFEDLYWSEFDHRGQSSWHYYLFAHYIVDCGGFYDPVLESICIADQSWADYCFWSGKLHRWARYSVTLHEHGHWLGMAHLPSGDCPCPRCAYAHYSTSVCVNPTYCVYHWEQGAWS